MPQKPQPKPEEEESEEELDFPEEEVKIRLIVKKGEQAWVAYSPDYPELVARGATEKLARVAWELMLAEHLEKQSAVNVNTPEYWDRVYAEEAQIQKKRLDEERLRLVRETIERRIREGKSQDLEVLDVAGGSGELSRYLTYQFPGIQVTTMDFSPEAIALAIRFLERLKYYTADAEKLDTIPDSSQEVVFCGETVEHLTNDRECIENLRRVTRDGGYVIITTPYKDRNKSPEHMREYDLNTFRDLIKPLGEVVNMDTVGDYSNWFSIVAVVRVRKEESEKI